MSKKLMGLFFVLVIVVSLVFVVGCGGGGDGKSAVAPTEDAGVRSAALPGVNYSSLLVQIDDLIAQVDALDEDVFKNGAGSKQALLNKLDAVRVLISGGSPVIAILQKLNNDILKSVDGCGGNSAGAPDNNDLISDCPAQVVVNAEVLGMISAVQNGGLASITISPAGPLTLPVGGTQVFAVTGALYENGTSALADVAGDVNWVSSDAMVGAVAPLVGSSTTFEGVTAGTTGVSVNLYGITSNIVSVTVTSVSSCGSRVVSGYTDPGTLKYTTPVFFQDDFNDGVWTDKWSMGPGSQCSLGPNESGGSIQLGTQDGNECALASRNEGGLPNVPISAEIDFTLNSYSGGSVGIFISLSSDHDFDVSIGWGPSGVVYLCPGSGAQCIQYSVPFPNSGTMKISYDPNTKILSGDFGLTHKAITATNVFTPKNIAFGVNTSLNGENIDVNITELRSNIVLTNHLISLSPLSANGIDYNGGVVFIWGSGVDVFAGGTPVFADGVMDINIGLISVPGLSRYGTFYTVMSKTVFENIMTSFGLNVDCFYNSVFEANGLGSDYIWNASSLSNPVP